ncbi:MAG: hypothetical protein MJ175_08215 [Clostridia bacterium]|nr:hypothetical protein [Clostridia bacterium]
MTSGKHRRLQSALCILLCACMLLFCACGGKDKTITPEEFLLGINELIVDDFGVISVTEHIGPYTSVTKITDRLYLTLVSDPVTNSLQQSELVLYFDHDLEKLDYSSFSYFFLILLKAYDPDITITNINMIHDKLQIESYDVGINEQIGYGSNTYFYQVTNEMAIFTAQYLIPAETLEP